MIPGGNMSLPKEWRALKKVTTWVDTCFFEGGGERVGEGTQDLKPLEKPRLKNNFFIQWLFLAALGLCGYVWGFCSCGKWRLLSSCCVQASHCSGFFCCRARALGCVGFSSCGTWAQWLWWMGLAASGHGESSWIKSWTCVPSIDKWTLYH